MVYKAWHENGFLQLYVNSSTNLNFTEMVVFTLDNLQIEGLEGEKQVFVRIGPGEEQLINISNIDDTKERNISSKVVEKTITVSNADDFSPS